MPDALSAHMKSRAQLPLVAAREFSCREYKCRPFCAERRAALANYTLQAREGLRMMERARHYTVSFCILGDIRVKIDCQQIFSSRCREMTYERLRDSSHYADAIAFYIDYTASICYVAYVIASHHFAYIRSFPA